MNPDLSKGSTVLVLALWYTRTHGTQSQALPSYTLLLFKTLFPTYSTEHIFPLTGSTQVCQGMMREHPHHRASAPHPQDPLCEVGSSDPLFMSFELFKQDITRKKLIRSIQWCTTEE